MQSNENTHVVYDGKQIVISPNLVEIFNFLSNVGKEIEDLLSLENKLVNIQKGYNDLLNFTTIIIKKVEENKIDFSSELTMKDIENSLKMFHGFNLPIRSIMIVLFSYIEVLYCINIAYLNQISDTSSIIQFARNEKNVKKFLNNYMLNDKNSFYKSNSKRFSKISAQQIRELRNLLVHFFSTNTEISISSSKFNEKARIIESELEKNGQPNLIFLSINDLYDLIKNASNLILIEWTNDCKKEPEKFKNKIVCVKKLITTVGSVFLPKININVNSDI